MPQCLERSTQPIRDPNYYFEGGDTIISVSGILFKIHRYLLARDGSIFEEMFKSMASTPGLASLDQDGRDDEHPIVLQGDTLEEFRAFVWMLYTLPHEIADISLGKDNNLLRLCFIAKMAHKYSFSKTEAWVLEALFTNTSNYYVRSNADIPLNTLEQLTTVAILCKNTSDKLLSTVRTRWKILIAEKKNLSFIMQCMEKFRLRDLEGCAYHAMMLEGRDAWNDDSRLTREQHIRLLSGYYNLSRYGRNLHNDPPPLDHDPACNSQIMCQYHWSTLWGIINARTEDGIGMQAMHHDKTDLLGRLTMAISVMKSFDDRKTPFLEDHDFASSPCRSAALKATIEMHARWSRDVIAFFSDMPPPEPTA